MSMIALLLFLAVQDGKVPEGHSSHGEAFNEGPRQAAYLMEGASRVSFPATTKSPEAQKFISQGVCQLHGFWYFEAERSFRQAAALDPECAIAYWGMAMANINNAKRAKGFIAEAVKRKAGASRREQMYIDARDAYLKADAKDRKGRNQKYTEALEVIVLEFSDDLEAKAFLCLQFYTNNSSGLPKAYAAPNALMEEVLRKEPLHPVHHFRIHLWDRKQPARALDSAARCGSAAPAIAHMWHMPGHIYSRLKRYGDAAWQQEASARVDHAQMMRDRLLPDQIHNFAHNNEWLIRNLIYVGRAHDAVDLAKNMIELPRHPKVNTLSRWGSAKYGRARLFQALEAFELWDATVELCTSAWLEPTDDGQEQVKRLRALGRAQIRSGDGESGGKTLDLLRRRAADAGADKGKKKGKKGGLKAELENAVRELEGWTAFRRGDLKEAAELLGKAKSTRLESVLRVRYAAGEKEAAIEAAREHVKKSGGEVLPLACLVELLMKDGREEEARKAFGELRKISARIDLDTPPFRRIAGAAAKFGFPDDWRVKEEHPADFGERPDLDSLGPFRWSPFKAPEWTLTDGHGRSRSLADYRGRPVLVIFYLGYACLHCAEQLQAFGPRAGDFEKEGISIIAVSSDNEAGLMKSVLNYDKGNIPFPLVANASLDVFRKYRCYDDFEKQTLHGTFLIDGRGRVLWHDISYDPFMDVDFTLKESKRLLAQSGGKAAAPADSR